MKTYIDVELSYVSPDHFIGNSCDFKNPEEVTFVKKAHLDDNSKKILNSTLRANFHIEFKTKKKNFLEISNEIEELSNDINFKEFFNLSKKIQEYILSVSKPVYPELVKNSIVENDWRDKLGFEKSTISYNTNLYNWSDDSTIENKILDILQEFVDKKLEKFVQLRMHYNCWQYFYKEQPISNFPLQTIIDHRRSHINM